MAYFPNGTEGSIYEAQYCDKCIHRKDPSKGECCPILMLHLLWNGDTEKDRELALDLFIPREGIWNKECTMFVEDTEQHDWEKIGQQSRD